MKIPLNVKKLFPLEKRLAPFVNFTLIAKKYRIFGSTEALVDTGSPSTTISPRDADKFHISVKTLKIKQPPISRIAGFKLPRLPMKNVTLIFRTEKNTCFAIKNYQIELFGPDISKLSKKDREALTHIPTIIGSDLLEDYGLALYFAPSKKISYLEKV